MMDFAQFDERPAILCIAGPNGAGKTTFYHAHLSDTALPYINADVLANELELDAYEAAHIADAIRQTLVARRDSFVFETVFSDPVGDKLEFLKTAAASGYTVVLCFIGISGPDTSEQRVAMRVSQGGHDVPSDKLQSRYPRIIENLKSAIRDLPYVLVFDNDDLTTPHRLVAVIENGQLTSSASLMPVWLDPLLP
ncbi:MAG: zeta toxin family protein [Planctomycetota bacterium]|jgi:predicted ABC-type ATPase